jgi:hypothetical protein
VHARAVLSLTVSLMAAGCVHYQESKATIDLECLRGTDGRVTLSVDKGTTDWEVHYMGFSNAVERYYFVIPFAPAERRAFTHREVSLLRVTMVGSGAVPALSSGDVTIDPGKREVLVALKTATGEFSGNGTYPIRSYPPAAALRADAKVASCRG